MKLRAQWAPPARGILLRPLFHFLLSIPFTHPVLLVASFLMKQKRYLQLFVKCLAFYHDLKQQCNRNKKSDSDRHNAAVLSIMRGAIKHLRLVHFLLLLTADRTGQERSCFMNREEEADVMRRHNRSKSLIRSRDMSCQSFCRTGNILKTIVITNHK